MTNATGERNLALIQEVLEVFPETARKERRKHMMSAIRKWRASASALSLTVNRSPG
ncbi:Nitrogenase molybdenum-iron protein alpha chain [Raoultella terrigena]|uniref:Nitrogenase molybdenum-iron protein alpha chain n=1 Tax=Raoultella terrigena TaxID=577 RepID=A0A4U9CT68_RAOTE|nr:Nitrogenase molybdenum-iron protein alpha chain [Raoultella terrigena]